MSEINNIGAAVQTIKSAILQSQLRVAQGGNAEQLSLYFGIGCYVSKNSRKGFWGSGAIDAISDQLQKEMPGLKGFGARNIKNMRQFYEEWSGYFNSAAVAAKIDVDQNTVPNKISLQLPGTQSRGFYSNWIYSSYGNFEWRPRFRCAHFLYSSSRSSTMEERNTSPSHSRRLVSPSGQASE